MPISNSFGFPSYPPQATSNSWGAPVWQQQLLEASYYWATGYAFHLEKTGGLRHSDTYRAKHCMGVLAPWLEDLSVHVYDDRLHPMVFTEGWGVDVAARQVWIDRELIERQVAQPEDRFIGLSWVGQGWAEMWVLVAGVMGVPRDMVESALAESRLRNFLDKTLSVQRWNPPEVIGESSYVQRDRLVEKFLPLPLQEILTTEQATSFGWPFVKRRSDMWPSSEEKWLHWAKAAHFIHVQNGLTTAPEKVDLFLEKSLHMDWEPECSFWVGLAQSGLESRRPGLLRAAQSPQAIPGLVAKGADPNALVSDTILGDSILSLAVRFRPHLVPALLNAGASWSSVPVEVEPWKEMTVHLGQAASQEWTNIELGLRLIPDDFRLHSQHVADMVNAFAKNQRFRGDEGLKVDEVIERTLRWLDSVNPDLDWLIVLEQVATPISQDFTRSLVCVLEKFRGEDLNQVVFSNQKRLPFSLLCFSGKSSLEQSNGWWKIWEGAGVLWELTTEESSYLDEASQGIYLSLQGAQRAQAKEIFLTEALAPAQEEFSSFPARRPRF